MLLLFDAAKPTGAPAFFGAGVPSELLPVDDAAGVNPVFFPWQNSSCYFFTKTCLKNFAIGS